MIDQYFTPTFKQAIENGIVRRDSFMIFHEGTLIPHEGWITRRFGVSDDLIFVEKACKDGYSVTHLESGYSVQVFEASHIALNFMIEIERNIPEFNWRDESEILRKYMTGRGNHQSSCLMIKQKKLF